MFDNPVPHPVTQMRTPKLETPPPSWSISEHFSVSPKPRALFESFGVVGHVVEADALGVEQPKILEPGLGFGGLAV